MQFSPLETTAGARADVERRTAALPPPRRISHASTLYWWIALAIAGVAAFYAHTLLVPPKTTVELPPGREREAFLALSFGKLAEEGDEVIKAQTFREELNALRSAGYTSVSLDDLQGFFREHRPLPDKPVLLLFDSLQRDSIEIADQAVAALGMHGVAFADVDAIAARNIDLVSIHRLQQLVESGRWEVGVAGCLQTGADAAPGLKTAADLTRSSVTLQEWTGQPTQAIDCQRAPADKEGAADAWQQTLSTAAIAFGFVVGNPRANFVDDPPYALRRIRVVKEWTGQDLLAALEVHEPRRTRFVDDFSGPTPRPDWIVDRADLGADGRVLRLASRKGDNGALVFLGGTDRWSDADLEVTVDQVPQGQFWMSLRSNPGAFLRLGVSHGRVVLQKADARGETHQVASREAPQRGFVLRLRLMGRRATASVDGVPLLDRPAEVPATLERGPVALAAWNADGSADARLKRVVATPLQSRSGIVPATPSGATWDSLREQAESFAVLSPRYFTWMNGHPAEGSTGDPALEIFASHHRLAFLPLVQIQTKPPFADFPELGAQLERWARRSGFGGLNLLVDSKLGMEPRWRSLVNDLRGKLRGDGRVLAVTLVDPDGTVPPPLQDFGGIFALSHTPGSALEFAQGPLALVGPPSG